MLWIRTRECHLVQFRIIKLFRINVLRVVYPVSTHVSPNVDVSQSEHNKRVTVFPFPSSGSSSLCEQTILCLRN
jgi:hypothetical protein